ncbi:annealing helicase [Fragilaria crotonensis]|nr:annealing helicase [Fragilaria crotonensis]
MGLGKTVQCIAAIDKLCKHDLSVLIVCPKSVMGVWESELGQWMESPFVLQIASPKSFPHPSDGSITLINYDICYKFRDQLHMQKYDVLICDEAHYLKSLTTKRTLTVLGNGKQATPGIHAEYTWLLTGTPVLNRPIELYPLLRAIAPDQFADFDAFANRYCNPTPAQRGRYSVMDYSGASNLPELSQRLEPYMLRRYKMDILTQLPPKFRSCVCLTGSSQVAELERERLRSIVAAATSQIEGNHNNPDLENFGSEASDLITYLGKCADLDLDDPANRNRIMGSLATVRMETALAKVDPAIELLQDILLLQKVVVFAHHREVILALMEKFGDQAVCVMGGTDMASRSLPFDGFKRIQRCAFSLGRSARPVWG